ncbi:MAG: MFS transporter [Nitrospira sp. BO4]|jgi:MHS family proline/betaine transporter-like MFS transporter|nr:MFS transporter [Nitrospira sp. BO4]
MISDGSRPLRKTVLAGAVGNVLEWYDFALFGYFAPVLSLLFFPSSDPSLSLIATFSVFAVGFLARPLGALLFGYWGDTRGRREALAWSILLMALPTCLVGMLPTYAQIGLAAPLALTALRFLQGLSVGGEFTGSVTFLVEHAAPAERGYIGSWAGFSAQIGALLGSGIGTVAAASLTHEALQEWGWRIPFLSGSLIALVGWYLRRRIPESPAFERLQQTGSVSSSPARELLLSHRAPLLQVIGLVLLHGVAFYMFYVFLPTYLTRVTDLPMSTTLTINTVCMALLAVLIPVMGKVSDRVGHRWILAGGAAGLALGTVPFFLWLSSGQIALIIAAQTLITVFVAAYMGPFFAIVATLFPVSRRYTGLSLSYNIAAALFGGTAPLLATILIERSGNVLAPGWYVSLCAILSLIVLSTIREETQSTTEDEARAH